MERKNRTIMEMACSMLDAKHLSNEYLDEVVSTIVYIMNRCPTKSVENKFPREAWTSMKHNVAHLKIFGCVAYAHVLDEMRKKIYFKGQKCIFFGYSEETKTCNMYDHVARKVIISHDIQFVENEAWDGSIERTVRIIDAIGHDHTKDVMVQTPIIIQCAIPSILGTATQILAQTTPVRFVGAESAPRAQKTRASSLSSSTSPYPILANLLPRKTRILRDIYNVDTTNSFSVFALFSQIDDPLTFE
jgi:hypothetical protein